MYSRRKESGVDDLVDRMRCVVVQVHTGDAADYLAELHLLGPYRYQQSRRSPTHDIHLLKSKPEYPRLMVIEPRDPDFEDAVTRLNNLYPNARTKPNARYIGEIYSASDLDTLQHTLESHNIRFVYENETQNSLYFAPSMLFTYLSDQTENRVGYTSVDIDDVDGLQIGEPLELDSAARQKIDDAVQTQADRGITDKLIGLDHCATRILSGEREDAILEFLTMVPYYYWGAYDIVEMNSSTNVNRHPKIDDDRQSPAKVFTANNVPSFVNSFENRPMPTEEFVRNFGRRMHHMAYAVVDGSATGENEALKNVDYVVDQLKDLDVEFLAHVVGECGDTPDLKQIFSKASQYSILITEYVERCHGFEGFFTKHNVAALTEAAGEDERFKHGQVFD